MNEQQKQEVLKGLLKENWKKRFRWRKPKSKFKGKKFIDFWNLTGNGSHHGTCAILLEPEIKPEEFELWGPFGFSKEISTWFEEKEIFLYALDWGIAGPEHFANSKKLRKLQRRHPTKKILLVGVRTARGKFWWIYTWPSNFRLVPKSSS